MTTATAATDGTTVTVHLPIAFRRIGGRKEVITPDGSVPWIRPAAAIDDGLILALARAWRWKKMLDDGEYATLAEIGAAEKVSGAYVGRALSLTLLAPDIVRLILDRRLPRQMTVEELVKVTGTPWMQQNSAGRRIHRIQPFKPKP